MPKPWTGRLVGKMHNHDITYDDLAAEMGVKKAYISMLLNSKREPPGIQKRMEDAVESIIRKRKEAINAKTENHPG